MQSGLLKRKKRLHSVVKSSSIHYTALGALTTILALTLEQFPIIYLALLFILIKKMKHIKKFRNRKIKIPVQSPTQKSEVLISLTDCFF